MLGVNKPKNLVSLVWLYVLDHNVALFLSMDPNEFYLMMDWSARGVSYALFAGYPSQIVLVDINFKEV